MLLNAFEHFCKICKHKHYVFINCCKSGIPFQGIKHDLSKFSPTEFFESVKYFQGASSPIDACKKANGYSNAWLHHKGRNRHHYEYWQDNFDAGGTPLKMPFKYAVEMYCDYIGAAKAYLGKNFSWEKEIIWWDKKKECCAMHKQTKLFIEECFLLSEKENRLPIKSEYAEIWNRANSYYQSPVNHN